MVGRAPGHRLCPASCASAGRSCRVRPCHVELVTEIAGVPADRSRRKKPYHILPLLGARIPRTGDAFLARRKRKKVQKRCQAPFSVSTFSARPRGSRKRCLAPFLGLPRTATGAKGAFEAQTYSGGGNPTRRSVGPTPPRTQSEGRQFVLSQGLIDETQPAVGSRYGPSAQQGSCLCCAALPTPQAAPPPVLRPRHQAGPHSVAFDVPAHCQEMPVRLDRERLEPPLVQMAVAAHPSKAVPAKGMHSRQPGHISRQGAVLLRVNHHVPVVRHHAVREDAHRNAIQSLRHHVHERCVIALAFENLRTPVGPVQDMVYDSTHSNARSSRHTRTIPPDNIHVNQRRKRCQAPFF